MVAADGSAIVFSEARYPGKAPIDAYGNGGFRFAEMSHKGSILVLPSGIQAWPVTNVSDLIPELISPILAERDQIEVLLFGTGAAFQVLPEAIGESLIRAGMLPELMNTGAAVRTYNVLLSENRAVAAALIAVDAPR